jgi:hypothetical protein
LYKTIWRNTGIALGEGELSADGKHNATSNSKVDMANSVNRG